MPTRLLKSIFQTYAKQLAIHPWRTQIASTGMLWAVGDALAQRVEDQPFDLRRNLLTAAYGSAFIGPVGHAWYMGLDRMAQAVLKPGTLAFVGSKVVADTVLFGPVHVAGYFTHMTVCEGGTMDDVQVKLRRDFWPTFSAELTAVNFKLVPVHFQLLVVNVFTILDSCFMSWSRANDGWFPRLFPCMAAQLGMHPLPASSSGAGSSNKEAKKQS